MSRRSPGFVLIVAALALGLATARAVAEESAIVKIVSVKVRETKPGGGAWDPLNGAPDLKILVEKKGRPAGDKFTTKVVPDTFEAKYDVQTVKVKEGDEIEVTVLDEDPVGGDDRVGKVTKKVTVQMIRKREAEWSFGEVLSLKVEFVD